jgi:hypothetical protein
VADVTNAVKLALLARQSPVRMTIPVTLWGSLVLNVFSTLSTTSIEGG